MTSQSNHSNQGNFPVSVSDIQDKYFDGKKLSNEEKSALANFNTFRLTYLKGADSEGEFEERYFELQIKAYLQPYTEFLKAG